MTGGYVFTDLCVSCQLAYPWFLDLWFQGGIPLVSGPLVPGSFWWYIWCIPGLWSLVLCGGIPVRPVAGEGEGGVEGGGGETEGETESRVKGGEGEVSHQACSQGRGTPDNGQLLRYLKFIAQRNDCGK